MNIVVLGGDGFCGWPTSLHLAAHGHNVTIIDNFIRRATDKTLLMNSLTPILPLEDRIYRWGKVKPNAAHDIDHYVCDVRGPRLISFLSRFVDGVDAIVHFAEQRSAPYSMVRPRYTVDNNIKGTHNVLHSIVELQEIQGREVPLIHLGTTGVYGYGENMGGRIPEGFLRVLPLDESGNAQRRPVSIPYPYTPGSVYHMTKCMDNLMFHYYAKNYGLKITDLHQGIVWGTQTEETSLHKGLINRFDFDGLYGTVLNRFVAQAACGHPLTVYGTGGQTRAFIHIKDTVRCVRLAVENPPEGEGLRIMNQLAETANVLELAKKINRMTGAEIRLYKNQRNEAVANALSLRNDSLLELGLEPTYLEDGLLDEIYGIAKKFRNRIDHDLIMANAPWNKSKETFDQVGELYAQPHSIPTQSAVVNDA